MNICTRFSIRADKSYFTENYTELTKHVTPTRTYVVIGIDISQGSYILFVNDAGKLQWMKSCYAIVCQIEPLKGGNNNDTTK